MAQSSEESVFASQMPQQQHIRRNTQKRQSIDLRRDTIEKLMALGQEACCIDEKGTIHVAIKSGSNLAESAPKTYEAMVSALRKVRGFERYRLNFKYPKLMILSTSDDDSNDSSQMRATTSPKPSIPRKRYASIDQTEVVQNYGSILTDEERLNIRIGDDKAVEEYFKDRIHEIPQLYLKLILKAWIKERLPKKQSTNPYYGGIVPLWWPALGCRHKEPDHLKLKERRILAKHLLYDIGVVVDTLRKSTNVVLSPESQEAKVLNDLYILKEKREQLFDSLIAQTKKKARDVSPSGFQSSYNTTSSPYDVRDTPTANSTLTNFEKKPQKKRKAQRRYSNTQEVAAEGQPNMLPREEFQDMGKDEEALRNNLHVVPFQESFYLPSRSSATLDNEPSISYSDGLSSHSTSTSAKPTRSSSVQYEPSTSYDKWQSTRSHHNYSDDMGGRNSQVAMATVSFGFPLSHADSFRDNSASWDTLNAHQYVMFPNELSIAGVLDGNLQYSWF
ncbi:MAG: hypothetical protein Q9167_006296 [Letrouitia subvulpina]